VRRRDWKLRGDILEAVQRVAAFIEGVSKEEFPADDKAVAAVSYELIVIGEATKGVPVSVQAAAPEVPWEKMRGMRNIVAHEYFGVDLSVVWDTATRDVPAIVAPLRALLERS
jgi:uncharacterized protein with HEPN domain